MMNSKSRYTHGPWEARLHSDNSGFGVFAAHKKDNDGREHSIVSANLYEQFAYTAFFDSEETQANACLIAAAPNLLAACKAANLRLLQQKSTVQDSDLLDEIQRAIIKAEMGI